jgi:hypothetical protein
MLNRYRLPENKNLPLVIINLKKIYSELWLITPRGQNALDRIWGQPHLLSTYPTVSASNKNIIDLLYGRQNSNFQQFFSIYLWVYLFIKSLVELFTSSVYLLRLTYFSFFNLCMGTQNVIVMDRFDFNANLNSPAHNRQDFSEYNFRTLF